MKKILLSIITVIFILSPVNSQINIEYDPGIQRNGIQYFTPAGGNQFVGDCIPFYHDGTYYLYWLLDEGHHGALNGLGGHQWTVSTTKDLKNWEHHPIVIGIDEDWEKSICTGSVAYDGKKFYAFYATRLINNDGEVNEQLSYATSDDGINFIKQKPNPFYTYAPGYSKRNFRDPKVIIDKEGTFHLFVTSSTNEYTIGEARGALVHLTSKDLKNWDIRDPLIAGQRFEPECPDYFYWKGWYYLIYGQIGDTYYLKSKKPYEPWIYPDTQALIEEWVNVAKTAEFKNGRRILAGWIPSRNENKDFGHELFGGSIVLREIIQLSNGDLATTFPEEVIPPSGATSSYQIIAGENAAVESHQIIIDAPGNAGGAYMKNVPFDCRITLDIELDGNNDEYGLFLRANDMADDGYKFSLSLNLQTVGLHNTRIYAVRSLNKETKVDIIMKGDFIDVNINNERCIVNRLPEKKGDYLWFYAKQGKVKFKNIKVSPLI